MLSICVDGPNGAGKSAVAALIARELHRLHLKVAVLTDTAVHQAVKSSAGVARQAIFPQTRAALRWQLLSLQPDIYVQERGLVSHLVFEHLAVRRPGGPVPGACCAGDCQPFFSTMVLTARRAVIEKRLRRRGGAGVALPLQEQIALFQVAARIAGWPIYNNGGPRSLRRIVWRVVGAVMAERHISRRQR